jgi:hypothetical protein
MKQSNNAPDTSVISTVLLILALALIVGGILYYGSAPPELTMGSEGWIESVRAHNDVEFRGTGMIMFGAFLLFASLAMSMRMRRAQLAWKREEMQAVAEGWSAGLRANSPEAPRR